tara:strand:+ start:846 stop:1430 length:585 start_codon:yes stop_codon:yes gene_type:complete
MATGDPVARRVIFGTHVVPTQSIEGEEASVRHTEFQPSPNGTLGGKGIATIDEDQWGDGWVSFAHQNAYWEDQDDVWQLQGETWSGILDFRGYWEDQDEVWQLQGELWNTTIGTELTDDTSPCKFLYIKNTGTINEVLVALDGGTNYYITVPPRGSINLRGDGTQLLCNEVFIKGSDIGTSITETTTIEYIIAK